MTDTSTASEGGTARPLRADARRNRQRVLTVASEALAKEGLSVPVHEIARRAGVGIGTVTRHFPTKEDLFAAVLQDSAQRFVHQARSLMESGDAGAAFFEFFSTLIAEGMTNRGMADALAGAGFDLGVLAGSPGHDFGSALEKLLTRAQQAGAVRGDVVLADLKALLLCCLAGQHEPTDTTATDRLISILCTGLGKA